MASPQVKNGYTILANEIWEHLVKLRIPPSEKDLLMCVIRKTYGFHKKEDRISLTQFEKETELSRVTVVKSLKNLLTRKLLVKRGILLGFNKDWETWVVNAGILVKSSNIFGKGGYTESGKGGYTYKRKKENKRNTTKVVVNTKMKYKENTIDYETGETREQPIKENKNKEAIRLALLFDKMATKYSKRPIATPKSYFIVLNAINKPHELTPDGIEKLFQDWFDNRKTREEDKVKLSFALSANNINAFKVRY